MLFLFPNVRTTNPTQNFCSCTDLFEQLVPITVHQAMSAYDGRKAEIVNTEIMKLRESTQFLNR
jgi:programmed cell death 6-interacting protein